VTTAIRRNKYPALEPVLVAAALDRFKEVPGQSKKHPLWPSKKVVESVAKQLRTVS